MNYGAVNEYIKGDVEVSEREDIFNLNLFVDHKDHRAVWLINNTCDVL